jgi:hypothetical protein
MIDRDQHMKYCNILERIHYLRNLLKLLFTYHVLDVYLKVHHFFLVVDER